MAGVGDVFKAVKDAVRALERAERRTRNKADWSDKASRLEYVREYKRKRRAEKIPANRVCPGCGKVKLSSKSWVLRQGKPAVCRGCDRRRK